VETLVPLVNQPQTTVYLVMLTETPHHTVIVMMDISPPLKTNVKLVVSDVLNVLTQLITVLNVMETEHLFQIAYAHLDIMKPIQYLIVNHAHPNVLNVPLKTSAQNVEKDISLMEANVF